MPVDSNRDFQIIPCWAAILFAAVMLLVPARPASAQFFRQGAVGGIAIDAQGVVSLPAAQATLQLRQAMLEQMGPIAPELASKSNLRRVSLRALGDLLRESATSGKPVTDDVRYLAGLQRIQYIFVYPELGDIVLVGPGEGWMLNEQGEVVGQTSGLPVMQLDDLLVALRTVEQARDVGVSCSIDPTAEGVQRMAEVSKGQRFSPQIVAAMEEALGAQKITLTGVPETSHFARVLVAADYRMKRIAMQLEASPIRELPSFLEMLAHSRMKLTNMMPRWWMACDYEPLARTEDGMGWELRGAGVKVMTEDDFVAEDGTRQTSGKKNDIAQTWADMMTAKFEPLAKQDAVFGQLRNIMDLCVVAAVIEQHGLADQSGCDLSVFAGAELEAWNAPKTVATQCSFTKRGKEYLITASGGVQIESWQVAQRSEINHALADVREQARMNAGRWWR